MRLNSPCLPAGRFALVFLPLLLAAQVALAIPVELRKVKTLSTDLAPKSCIVSPDGKTVYVLNLEGMSVQAFDAESKEQRWRLKFNPTPASGWDYTAHKPIKSYAEKPVEAAFSQDGRYLWVSLHNDESVVVIDTRFGSPFTGTDLMKARLQSSPDGAWQDVMLKRIKVGKTPKVIAITPDDRFAYVANWHSYSISVIDARTFAPIKEVKVSSIPRGLAVTPDGKELFATIMGGTELARIDVSTQTLLGYEPIGKNPRHVVATADGRHLYVSLNGPGDVLKYSLAEGKVVGRVHVGQQPRTLTLSPDGRHLFVVQYKGGQLAVVDTATMAIEGQYPAGTSPVGIAITPDGKEVWVVSYSSSTLDVFAIEEQLPTLAAKAPRLKN